MSGGLAFILVHGYLGSPDDLAPLTATLAPLATTLIALTLPGHDAACENPPDFDSKAFLAVIAQAIDTQQAAGHEIVLIGHSTGGSLLIAELSRRISDTPGALTGLRHLILCATPPRLDLGYAERWTTHRGTRPSRLDDLAALGRLIRACGPAALARLPAELRLTVIHGTADELVPCADSELWLNNARPISLCRAPDAPHQLFRAPVVAPTLRLFRQAVLEHLPACTTTLNRLAPELRLAVPPNPDTVHQLLASPAGRRALGLNFIAEDRAAQAPTLANIEITTRCTLGCPACARTRDRVKSRHMPRASFERILAALPHALRLTLVGLGEPLLHPEVVDFVGLAVAAGRHVELVTSAMTLDTAMGKQLCSAGLAGITFSLDAVSPEVVARVRPGSDMTRIASNLHGFMAHHRTLPQPPDTAVFTALRHDTVGELQAIVDFTANLGIGALMLSDLNFASNRSTALHGRCDATAAASLRAALRHAARRSLPVYSVRGLEEYDLPRRHLDYLVLRGEYVAERSAQHTHCFSPWQTASVSVDGNLAFCDCQPEMLVGSLLGEAPVDTLWNGPTMRAQRQRMLSATPPPACLACPRF